MEQSFPEVEVRQFGVLGLLLENCPKKAEGGSIPLNPKKTKFGFRSLQWGVGLVGVVPCSNSA